MGKMNRYVIYTAVVGNYDEIKQPQVVDNRFDYILFSNDIKEKNVGIWQVRPIPYHNPILLKTQLIQDYDNLRNGNCSL